MPNDLSGKANNKTYAEIVDGDKHVLLVQLEITPLCFTLRYSDECRTPWSMNVAFYFQRLRRHSFVRILERINSNPVYG
jgi:hypothetical protein